MTLIALCVYVFLCVYKQTCHANKDVYSNCFSVCVCTDSGEEEGHVGRHGHAAEPGEVRPQGGAVRPETAAREGGETGQTPQGAAAAFYFDFTVTYFLFLDLLYEVCLALFLLFNKCFFPHFLIL